MHSHVPRVAQTKTCFYHLRRIRVVRRQLGRDVTARLVTALVLSRLDDCNAVLAGLPASMLAPFQRVLHAPFWISVKPRDRVTPALRELHWLPVAEGIQYKLCLLVHKSLLGHTPEYLRPSDIGCQYSMSIHTTRFIVWQRRCAADTSTNWRQSLFCCCTASMEQATDGAETAAIDGLVSL